MKAIAIALSAALLSGCASITARPVTDANPAPEGLRVYGVMPILIIDDAGPRVEIIPDLSNVYAVRFDAFLAKNDATLTVNPNGTLQSLQAALDSTDAIGLIESLLDKIPGLGAVEAASGQAATASGLPRGVYAFVLDDAGDLVGLRPLLTAADDATGGGGSAGAAAGGTAGGGGSGGAAGGGSLRRLAP